MSNTFVLVDDTDPDIQYTGPWSTAQNTQLNAGTNGPPYQNTLHVSNVNNASFSYSFSGTSRVISLLFNTVLSLRPFFRIKSHRSRNT